MTKKTMTPDQIRAALSDRNLSTVAERTGLSADTLYRIANGEGTPTHATLVVLSIYLDGGFDGEV
jgi:DNA-binding phage protein